MMSIETVEHTFTSINWIFGMYIQNTNIGRHVFIETLERTSCTGSINNMHHALVAARDIFSYL